MTVKVISVDCSESEGEALIKECEDIVKNHGIRGKVPMEDSKQTYRGILEGDIKRNEATASLIADIIVRAIDTSVSGVQSEHIKAVIFTRQLILEHNNALEKALRLYELFEYVES